MEAPTTPCGHKNYAYGHCGTMSCWNYLSKCSVHAIASYNRDKECTQDKKEQEVVETLTD